MGNIFSKPKNLNEQLFEFEEKILNTETRILQLRKNVSVLKLFAIVFAISAILVVFDVHFIISILCGVALFFLTYVCSVRYKNSCIRMEEYKLKKLKEDQKNFVQRAKEDANFAKTRRLIEKYETEESKKNFFNTVINKRQTNAEKFAGMLLGNDPTKMYALICTACGLHNGLIDPKNNDIDTFHCYECKHKNIRKDPEQKKKTVEEMFEGEELFELSDGSTTFK